MTTCDETTCDEIETHRHANLAVLSLRALNLGPSNLASLTKLLLFVVMQCLTVVLIGFVALFVRFGPVWSEEAPQVFARPGDAHTGSLLLKTDDGYADATRLGVDVDLTVSGPTIRARITQIANLLCLAPDIQEQILFLPPTEQGRDPIHLALLQPLARTLDWKKQRRLWTALVSKRGESPPQKNIRKNLAELP